MNELTPLLEITKNELVYDMEWDDYVSATGLNASTIAPGLKSLKHLYASRLDDDKSFKKPKDTTRLLIGSATHALVLEPESFYDRFAVYSGPVRRGKEWTAFVEENEGREILKTNEYDEICRAGDAVVSDPRARELLDATHHEVSGFVGDFDLQCKFRADMLGNSLVCDLKGTADVSPSAFGKIFSRMAYGPRMACYVRWSQLLGEQLHGVKIIAHEQHEPWDVVVFDVPMTVIEQYWERVERKVMRSLRVHIQTGIFPGVADGRELPMDVPMWDMETDEVLDWS